MANVSGRNLPPPQSPFVDQSSLNLSYDGYQFLLRLLTQAESQQSTVSLGLESTGNSQATALQLPSQWNEVDDVPAGTGVLLSSYQAGESQTVYNEGANALDVYPPPGSAINSLSENAAFSLAAGDGATFKFLSSAQIRT